MIKSEFDGRRVRYVDAALLAHTGAIVGQSEDRQWLYVQSDSPSAPPANWHFKISRSVIGGVLEEDSNA